MKKDIIFTAEKPSPLLELLRENITSIPRGKIKSCLEHRQVSVDGVITTKFDFAVRAGQNVKVSMSEGSEKTRNIEIIYEDEWFLAVNKPAKLLTVATDGEKQKTAYALLSSNRKGKIFVLHRLDRDTSGVLLFAKNAELRDAMQESWNDIITLREYRAICEGHFKNKRGVCNSLVSENSAHKVYSSDSGKRAVTEYEVVSESQNYSMVRINLKTGRKNQIRVHMQELGNPVCGDKKYGAESNPIGRLGLHASALGFIHPVTKKEILIRAKPERKFALPK